MFLNISDFFIYLLIFDGAMLGFEVNKATGICSLMSYSRLLSDQLLYSNRDFLHLKNMLLPLGMPLENL